MRTLTRGMSPGQRRCSSRAPPVKTKRQGWGGGSRETFYFFPTITITRDGIENIIILLDERLGVFQMLPYHFFLKRRGHILPVPCEAAVLLARHGADTSAEDTEGNSVATLAPKMVGALHAIRDGDDG